MIRRALTTLAEAVGTIAQPIRQGLGVLREARRLERARQHPSHSQFRPIDANIYPECYTYGCVRYATKYHTRACLDARGQ